MMKRIGVGLLAIALSFGAVETRAAIVTLQGEATIDSAVVTLGDLFTGLETAQAATVVANAPRPGARFVYDARTLTSVAQRYGLAWTPQSQTDRVTLTRAANIVAVDQVRKILIEELRAHVPAERFTVALDQARITIALPTEIAPNATIENLTYDRTARRFEADLIAAADTPFAVRSRVSGAVAALVEVPVLKRRLQTGEVIAQADIDWVEIDSRELRADSVTQAEQLIGMTPRRALLADQPISLRAVQAPVLVEKGALVTMRLLKPNLQLTAQGRALSNGGKGDLIRIQNLTSNRIIEAVVEANDTVVVPIAQPATVLSQGIN
jgi:flagella basal body P-ring formation protein FlgA